VLRVKRVRAPDAVCFERLEHALRDAQKQGFTVLLAGVRPDLLRGMRRLGFDEWLAPEQWFLEQDNADSATLEAVRKAYDLVGIQRRQGDAVVYYLV